MCSVYSARYGNSRSRGNAAEYVHAVGDGSIQRIDRHARPGAGPAAPELTEVGLEMSRPPRWAGLIGTVDCRACFFDGAGHGAVQSQAVPRLLFRRVRGILS